MDDTLTLDEAMSELSTAEEFLDYFEVAYDQNVVHVNRLHILQRFHDYIARYGKDMPEDDAARTAFYTEWLTLAYNDFVKSDALTEKVFRVFQSVKTPEGGTSSFVSLDRIFSN